MNHSIQYLCFAFLNEIHDACILEPNAKTRKGYQPLALIIKDDGLAFFHFDLGKKEPTFLKGYKDGMQYTGVSSLPDGGIVGCTKTGEIVILKQVAFQIEKVRTVKLPQAPSAFAIKDLGYLKVK